MSNKQPWSQVEDELMENVFYAHEPDRVRGADDLAKAGLLDSLSIVAILEVLIEASGDEDAFEAAEASNFRNLGTIKALYEAA